MRVGLGTAAGFLRGDSLVLAGEVLLLVRTWRAGTLPEYVDSGDMLELIADIERLCLKAEPGRAP